TEGAPKLVALVPSLVATVSLTASGQRLPRSRGPKECPEGRESRGEGRALLRYEGKSLPRAGRPKSYTDRDVRNLIRYVRLHPKDTYAEVRKALRFNFSTTTLKVMLKPSRIVNWRCKKRPYLLLEVVEKRLE
ncbi:hypothetical protein M430DRAFT_262520, partial [Amorphotheca resinae ATCC 22711]